jgi:hypothetical protein
MFYTSIAMCQNEKNRRRIAKDKNNENRDKKPGKKKYETTIAIFCAAMLGV